MLDWHNIEIEKIGYIEKCVAEFNVGESGKTPWSKFKVRIYEYQDGMLIGHVNLSIKDSRGVYSGYSGHGGTIEDVLEDTILYFLELLKDKGTRPEEDFEIWDFFDF